MQEVELLLVPLLFGWAHANFTLSEGGGGDEDRGWRLQRPGCGEHGFDARNVTTQCPNLMESRELT